MIAFVFGLILLALGIIATVSFIKTRKNLKDMRAPKPEPEQPVAGSRGYDPYYGRSPRRDVSEEDNLALWERLAGGAAIVFFFFGFLMIGLDSYTVIPSRNVGIPVTFGQVGQPLDSGPHLVLPWTDVTKVDATTQNINRNADEGQWASGNCTAVLVRLASGASACVDITSQWNVSNNAPAASNLWTQYRGNTDDADKTNDNFITNLTNNVVDREIQRAMNTAFASYNPIVVGNDNQAVNTPLDLKTYSANVLGDLKSSVPGGVDITEFLISHVHFDRATQDKINQLAQAKADTQIALQKELTAGAIAAGNAKLATAASNDSGVMFQNCLNLVKELAASGQLANLPVNSLQCVSGGSGTPVIVDTTKK